MGAESETLFDTGSGHHLITVPTYVQLWLYSWPGQGLLWWDSQVYGERELPFEADLADTA